MQSSHQHENRQDGLSMKKIGYEQQEWKTEKPAQHNC